MWGGYGMGWGYGWGVPGIIHMLLWWILIIVAIVALIRWVTHTSANREPPRENRALEVLKERYARGEIGKEEFEQKKRDLGG
jgi:putative membrane protein